MWKHLKLESLSRGHGAPPHMWLLGATCHRPIRVSSSRRWGPVGHWSKRQPLHRLHQCGSVRFLQLWSVWLILDAREAHVSTYLWQSIIWWREWYDLNNISHFILYAPPYFLCLACLGLVFWLNYLESNNRVSYHISYNSNMHFICKCGAKSTSLSEPNLIFDITPLR